MFFNINDKTKRKNSPNSLAIWGAFISFYCWFSVVPYNFNISPLKSIAIRLGASLSSVVSVFFICFAIGSIIALTILDDRFPKPLFLLIQILWILLSLTIFFSENIGILYVMTGFQGLFSGILFAKIIFFLIFFTPHGSWVRNIAIIYLFVQPIIYIYLVLPMKDFMLPAYILGIAMQALSLVFSWKFNGKTQEVRRYIPEATISLKAIAVPIVIIFFVFACLAAVKNTIMPSFAPSRIANYLQIFPNAITLAVLIIWGTRFKRIHFLQISLILLSLTFLSFQLFQGSIEGRLIADWLMQPAYLIWDVFIFSFIADITYKYGKKYARPRILFLSITVTIGTAEFVTSYFINKVDMIHLNIYAIFYIVSFILILLIPLVQKLLTKEMLLDLDPYAHLKHDLEPAENEDEYNLENEMITDNEEESLEIIEVSLYEKMLSMLSGADRLTARESEILKLLCERQDYDVISTILKISKNTVKIHVKNIFTKYKVKNRRDFYELMEDKEQVELTKREREILELVAAGKGSREIAQELFISEVTARVHIWNICKKFSVSSIPQLQEKLKEPTGKPLYGITVYNRLTD